MPFDSAFFDAGLNRMGVSSVKWETPSLSRPDGIPLWVADMDFPTAPAITEALVKRAMHPNYGYTFMDAKCKEALCAYWQRRHDVRIAPVETGLLPSVVSGLRVSVAQFTQPGEGVIIQSPVYGPFYHAVTSQGRRVLEAPLKRDGAGRYDMDLDAVKAHLESGAKLMLLCSPHNPISRAWDKGELEALIALLVRYGCALVSDEIHADFVYSPKRFISVMRLDTGGIKALSLTAASKTFNIAGLQQASILCRDDEVMRQIGEKLQAGGVEAGNIFALVANRAAYTQGDEWLDGLLAYLDGTRAILADELARLLPGAVLSPIEATFLAWVDIRAYGKCNAALFQACREAGVLPTDGTFFGETAGEGFMRINFGCPRKQLIAGLERFARAVKG